MGFAEALMAGECECDDLFTLVRIFVRNDALSQRLDRGLARLGGLWAKGLHALRRNTRLGARRDIHQHYDLGNDFYR